MKQLNNKAAFVFLISLIVGATFIGSTARAELLVESGDWTAFKEADSGGSVCFASSQPTKDVGDYKKRGDIFAIVTFRPQENTINEVSFQMGYDFKSGEDAIATIDGKKTFKMFTQNESAWTYDKKSDEAMVAAMRAGTTMVLKGISSRGTKTTDTYSLKGFTKALNAAAKSCGIK
ncbi:MAG: invasion associated locus B family protein [Rhodospirillaceae bacterium]|nr:invasion associated locus B family protein [Rhodospirillaceae bacterium]